MSTRWARSSIGTAVLIVLALTQLAIEVPAQKVRLRSVMNPDCQRLLPTRDYKFSDIYADGNIAVQGTSNCTGVFIYDISNADNPVLTSRYNPSASNWFPEAIVVGNRGYFGSGLDAGVHVVDLTNPYNPVLLGVVDPSHANGFAKVHEMVVWGNYLIENFNGTPNFILKFINISDPANPVFVRDLVLPGTDWGHAMHIRGNRMIVSRLGGGSVRGRSEIYDISNVATQTPTLLGTVNDNTGGSVPNDRDTHSSWTSEDGNYLYSCREEVEFTGQWDAGDLRVYDIHDPASPVLVDRITAAELGLNASTPHNPVVKGNRLYVAWYQAGLQVFDITDPANPLRIGQYDTYPGPFQIPVLRSPRSEPWDVICGDANARDSAVAVSFEGDWAVYPFLGDDRILAGDTTTGLHVLDTTQIGLPPKNRVSDFDGDRKTDLSVFRPSTATWLIENSSGGAPVQVPFGVLGDVMVPGDYDGDGQNDIAIYRPSTGFWWIRHSSAPANFIAVQFGISTDIPVPADYDADGRTDLAVWRPSNGSWYIWQSTLGPKTTVWGLDSDKPVTGDFEGDGKADLAVWRPSNGVWYILQSSSSIPKYAFWGTNGDRPLSADFDGNGVSDYAVYRPSNGTWYILDPLTGATRGYAFGIATDMAIPADYDGDAKADVTVFRPSTNEWYRINSSNGTVDVRGFGQTGDRPSPSSIQPQ